MTAALPRVHGQIGIVHRLLKCPVGQGSLSRTVAGVSALLDAIIPPRCAACGRPGHGWCDACAEAAEALRLRNGGATSLTPAVAAVGVYAYDGVVADAVRGMKLSGRFGAAKPLGQLIRGHPAVPGDWPITWVPSTARRRRDRGFELPQLLAGAGARPLLRRTLQRADQTDLTPQQRRAFPLNAFVAVQLVPADVVLVDDVRTTGGTAVAAATALIRGGARRVLVATFAVGGDDARTTAG